MKDRKILNQWIEVIGLNQVKEVSVTLSPIGNYKVLNILRKDGLRTIILIPNEAMKAMKEA
jgi:hypothetical protein